MEGYSLECNIHRKSGGDIGVYIKDGIQYIMREDLEYNDLEMMRLEYSLTNNRSS